MFISTPAKDARRRAVAAAELAILLPVLCFMFVVIVDFSRIVYYTMTIENCLHNGAIFGSRMFDNQNQQWVGSNQYWEGPSKEIVSTENSATELDGTNLSPALADANVNVTSGTDADGNSVSIVTITYTFPLLCSCPPIPSSFTITRSAQVRVCPPLPN
jgi:hypothetical protein